MSAAAPAPTPSTATTTPTPGPGAPGPVLAPPAAPGAAPAEPGAPPSADPAKAPASEPKAAAAPEKYDDFKLPEGLRIADEDLTAFTAYARARGLDQQGAQEAIDLAAAYGQRILAGAEAAKAEKTSQQDAAWAAEIQADPQLGGATLPKTLELVGRARAAFDPTGEVAEVLAAHGLANNPALVRFVRRIGEALREDSPPPGTPGVAAPAKDPAELLYPNDRARS